MIKSYIQMTYTISQQMSWRKKEQEQKRGRVFSDNCNYNVHPVII